MTSSAVGESLGRPRRLVVAGSVLVDVMLGVPRWPERGGDLLATESNVTAGGGFVVLAAARRLGLPAVLLGRVGDGAFGAAVSDALAALDVPVLVPPTAGEDTGFTVGLVEPDGERTFVTSPGVESRLTAADLAAWSPASGDVLYVSGYDLCYPVSGPALAALVGHCAAPVVFDPGPLAAEIPADLLNRVLAATSLLTLNAREADLLDMSTVRATLPPDATVVQREGAAGCVLRRADGSSERFAAPAVDVVDTTGAGDTHTGALLAELARSGSLDVATHAATVAASLSVTRFGSATGPSRDELAAAVSR